MLPNSNFAITIGETRIFSERQSKDAEPFTAHMALHDLSRTCNDFCLCADIWISELLPKAPQINAQQKSETGLKSQSKATDQKDSPAPSAAPPPEAAPSGTTPKSQRDTYHGDDEGTEFWPPFFGLRLKITDSLLALFTFGLFVATWFLYVSTRDLVEGADRRGTIACLRPF